ncbi:UDP-glucose/GDP-mannose dehydrogenase family protein [Bacillus sp. AFS055030]|uniref:UDP-glucose dehydrogenase family protein n=1 Tax=Bacillus sp. AFS055030 TaxID=2033507 RepID=UPI000BFB6855|nr:UDP-glucose/GDP-mannose dehydrogenase family protein [Bacillus sp. AFS055030]PGL69840.1 UDP-glucose 6-dehydrogenase [Bacillus sp. AFS055030]
MKISILGTGYVGLTTGVCLAEIGHLVTCIDINELKIKNLCAGISPIYEPGIEELIANNIQSGRLSFTTSYDKGLEDAKVIIIAVGTPQREDGSANLSYLEGAAIDIAKNIKQDVIIAIKSTVPVGTNELVKEMIQQNCSKEIVVDVVSNPEFLRQGSAIKDTMEADRIIIGSNNQESARIVEEIYKPLNVPILITSIRSAEMIKYASNAFLASKISFINEIANLCEALGANVEDVAKGMGKDKRIGEAFLYAGIGYGGSCFPKDVKALLHTAELNGVEFGFLKETIYINNNQRELLVKKAIERFGSLIGKRIACLGLSFKPDTDDMREAPSITIIKSLTELGAEVIAYDPVAIENAKKILGSNLTFASSINECVTDTDAIFIITEWQEFRELDLPNIFKKMKNPIIFDGRNCLKEEKVRDCMKIEYYPVGKPSIIQ